MGFTRSTYPDIPGVTGAPCWTLRAGWVYADVDWNTRPPFGFSFCVRIGPQPDALDCPNWNPGFTLDVNPPLGEPNRLYLFAGRWLVTVGLPEFRDFEVTSRETGPSGRQVIHGVHYTNWLHPHIAGISRYRYHKNPDGDWVRDAKPTPGHWGWLTIERKQDGREHD